MQRIGKRPPPPPIPMTARNFPPSWRPIIAEELTGAQVSIRSLTGGKHRDMARLRRKIWMRLVSEVDAVPYQVAQRFGYDHTTVYYALGRLKDKPCEYAI